MANLETGQSSALLPRARWCACVVAWLLAAPAAWSLTCFPAASVLTRVFERANIVFVGSVVQVVESEPKPAGSPGADWQERTQTAHVEVLESFKGAHVGQVLTLQRTIGGPSDDSHTYLEAGRAWLLFLPGQAWPWACSGSAPLDDPRFPVSNAWYLRAWLESLREQARAGAAAPRDPWVLNWKLCRASLSEGDWQTGAVHLWLERRAEGIEIGAQVRALGWPPPIPPPALTLVADDETITLDPVRWPWELRWHYSRTLAHDQPLWQALGSVQRASLTVPRPDGGSYIAEDLDADGLAHTWLSLAECEPPSDP